MAIALDAHTEAGYAAAGAPTNPATFSHTTGSGSDRLLVVTVQMRAGAGGVVTGVTYAGVALTEVTTEAINGAAHTTIWYLINPATGSNTVSITHSLTGTTNFIASATTLTGVHQTTPLNAFNKAAASDAGPMTVSLTTTVADCWVIDSCAMRVGSSETASMTAVTNRVSRTNFLTAANGVRGLSSTIGPAAAAGSHTCEWTKTLNQSWAIMAAAFAPAAAGGALTAATTLTFTTAASMVANGALAGTASPVFTTAANLTATGALSGTSALAFSPTASITGLALASGSASLAFSTAGSLAGRGALAGASVPAFALTGAMSGAGALSGTASLAFAPTATASGSGVLTASSALAFSTAGLLGGRGALAGTCPVVFSLTGNMAAPTGEMGGSASLSFSTSGSVAGAGALAGTLAAAFSTAGAISGIGALSASTAWSFATTGLAVGAGELSGTIDVTFTAAGNVAPLGGGISGSVSFAFLVSGTLFQPPFSGQRRTTYGSPIPQTRASNIETTYASPRTGTSE